MYPKFISELKHLICESQHYKATAPLAFGRRIHQEVPCVETFFSNFHKLVKQYKQLTPGAKNNQGSPKIPRGFSNMWGIGTMMKSTIFVCVKLVNNLIRDRTKRMSKL